MPPCRVVGRSETGLELLSNRERQVLEHLASGRNNDAIAAELGLATQTVRNYISTVYDKIGVHARGEAIVWARERGIVSGWRPASQRPKSSPL